MTQRPCIHQVMKWTSASFVFALLFLFFPYFAPTASADDNGNGYEFCYTNYPGVTGYVAGQPTYISAVFAYHNGNYNGPLRALTTVRRLSSKHRMR